MGEEFDNGTEEITDESMEEPLTGASSVPLNDTSTKSKQVNNPFLDDPNKPPILEPRLLLRENATNASVAAIIAIHPPKFPFLVDFMLQYWTCPSAVAAMDVWPIFNNNSDHEEFVNAFCSKCPNYITKGPLSPIVAEKCRGICANWAEDPSVLPWKPLHVQMHKRGSKNLASWKKIDGLAQLVQFKRTYEFALLMDSETAIINCRGFDYLKALLRKKHRAKLWYGDVSDTVCNTEAHILGAARSIAERNTRNWTHLARATRNFTVYLWWNDIPYVHMPTAQEMFDHWADKLQNWIGLAELPEPMVVSQKMGEVRGLEQLNFAAKAFEHMVYQLYTVLKKGWEIKDLTPKLHHHSGLSLGERVCWLSDADLQTYAAQVHPLWVRGGCEIQSYFKGTPPLMAFHMDRVMEVRAKARET